MSLRKLPPLAPTVESGVIKRPTKTADPFYSTPEYETWRETVIDRAGRRCQVIDNGRRCRKGEPAHRMFADHVIEVSDGGARYDPANGQCLCGSHHTIKTMRERARRAAGILP
jgi:5-methylcytosine-specific restriction protein A